MLTGLRLADRAAGKVPPRPTTRWKSRDLAAAERALDGFEDEPGLLWRMLRPGQGHGREADGDDVEELVGPTAPSWPSRNPKAFGGSSNRRR